MEHQAAPSIFLTLQESALGHVMRSSPSLYPAVEILHIIGFVVLVGSILALDLRMLGLGRAIAIPPMAQMLLPLSRAGLVLTISMGFLLFGFGDPPGFRVDDCATQRNLSDKGRADAAKIGARLQREGIAFGKILSSPWCRCMDTATLLNLGPVEAEATFGNVVVLRDQRDALTAGARALIAKWSGTSNLLVVTHGANIAALTTISPASGEIVVVRGGSSSVEPVGRLLLD